VWSSALVSNVGSWVQTVALGTLVTSTTHNAFWTALVLAAGFLPMGLLAPVGGVLADRFDRRRWLIVTTVAEASFAVVLAVVVGLHHDPNWVLVLLSFLGGASGSIGFPAYQAMLPDLVRREDLLAAVSLSSAQWNMGRVMGPAIAGLILVAWSPAVAFSLNAISFGAVVIALLLVRLPHRERASTNERMWERLRSGARTAMGEPSCRSAIFLISIVALIGSPFIGLISAEAIDGLHQRTGGPAVLTTAQGIGAVLGALCIAPLAKRFGQHFVVIGALFGFAVSLVLYGGSPKLAMAAVGIALVGGTYIGVLSGLNSLIQLRAPEEARGRVLSIFMMALGIIYPIGLIIEGMIGQAIGVPRLTALTGVTLLLVFGLLALFSPQIFRSLRAPESLQGLDLATPEVAEIDLAAGVHADDARDSSADERR